MAAVVWQPDTHILGFSQQSTCAKECEDNACKDLSLGEPLSFQEPLVTPLKYKGCIFYSQGSLGSNVWSQKGALVPNISSANGLFKNDDALVSSMQNNVLCHMGAWGSPESSYVNNVNTLFDLEAQNSSKAKIYRYNFPSKFSVGGHKVNPSILMDSNHVELGQKKTSPYMEHCKKAQQKKKRKCQSQFDELMTAKQLPCILHEAQVHSKSWPSVTLQQRDHCTDMRYMLFQTGIGRFRYPSQCYTTKSQSEHTMIPAWELSVERYFNALQGPELSVLREHEASLLPLDEVWPYLLRFPIACFSICLGLGSQTILWKTLSSVHTMEFLHIPKQINLILWCVALVTLFTVFTTYILKCLFYFEAVRREFFHPVRINFFFAPWIACMLLTLGVPPAITTTTHPIFWAFFMGPVFALELKIYGQWFSGGKRRLSRVANPSTHLSLMGNFVGALLAAAVGWKETAIFFWAVGFVHYLVLLVTLYQRSPFTAGLPKELHPIFFLFLAAPSTASVAWSQIVGHFDMVSKLAYFLALFLYLSLVVRANFFRGFPFSVAWWAYTFPTTTFANATIHYSLEVKHPFTQGLAAMLSMISSVVFLTLAFFSMLHLYQGTMFPNDVAIAITEQNYKRKQNNEGFDKPWIMPRKFKSFFTWQKSVSQSGNIFPRKRVAHESASGTI